MSKNAELQQADKDKAAHIVETLLSDARTAISAAEQILARADEGANRHYRVAAEHISNAQAQKASQRQIAEVLGKSAAWVNRLLRWRTEGYPDSPFGPQSSLARARKKGRSGATEQAEEESSTSSQNNQTGDQNSSAPTKPETSGPAAMLDAQRDRLLKLLGMLGSNQDGECLGAARKAEELRIRMGLSWDQLIVPVQTAQARAA